MCKTKYTLNTKIVCYLRIFIKVIHYVNNRRKINYFSAVALIIESYFKMNGDGTIRLKYFEVLIILELCVVLIMLG